MDIIKFIGNQDISNKFYKATSKSYIIATLLPQFKKWWSDNVKYFYKIYNTEYLYITLFVIEKNVIYKYLISPHKKIVIHNKYIVLKNNKYIEYDYIYNSIYKLYKYSDNKKELISLVCYKYDDNKIAIFYIKKSHFKGQNIQNHIDYKNNIIRIRYYNTFNEETKYKFYIEYYNNDIHIIKQMKYKCINNYIIINYKLVFLFIFDLCALFIID